MPKDSGAGNRPLTEEERAWYQDQVDQINEVFINFVAEGRDMPVEDVRALGHGPYVHRHGRRGKRAGRRAGNA